MKHVINSPLLRMPATQHERDTLKKALGYVTSKSYTNLLCYLIFQIKQPISLHDSNG